MMKHFLSTILVLSTMVSTVQADEPQQPNRKTKIVLIGHKPDHPFGSHMYLQECRLLAKCLQQTPHVETVVSDGWPKDPSVLENVSAIVFYTSPAGDILLKESHRKQAEQLLADGVGLAAIHWATGSQSKELGEEYLQILGGWFHTDFCTWGVDRSLLSQVDGRHPICRGWEEYELRDEFYRDLKFLPETQPILKVTTAGKEQVVAWAYERPDSNDGRSFGTTLAHFHDNFEIVAFRRAIINGILWTAHVEIPQEGAPVELTPQDLVLEKEPAGK